MGDVHARQVRAELSHTVGVIPDAREREPEPRGHARRRLSLSPLGSGSRLRLARNDRDGSCASNANDVKLGRVPGVLVDGFAGIDAESPR